MKKTTKLTKTEIKVLKLLAVGETSKDIAYSLGISINTVHVHRNNIMKKLDIHKQAKLTIYAIKNRIIKI